MCKPWSWTSACPLLQLSVPSIPYHLDKWDDSRAKKCDTFPCLRLCMSFSANVWPFVYEDDKWCFGKMQGDLCWCVCVWEPCRLSVIFVHLSPVFHDKSCSSCSRAEAVWDELGFSVSLFSNFHFWRISLLLARCTSWQWPQTTSQTAGLFFCPTCFPHSFVCVCYLCVCVIYQMLLLQSKSLWIVTQLKKSLFKAECHRIQTSMWT